MAHDPIKTKQALAITVDEFGNIISTEEKTVPVVQGKAYVSAPKKQTCHRASHRNQKQVADKATLPLVKPKPSLPTKASAALHVVPATPTSQSLVICPVCRVNVKATRLAKHLQNVHQLQQPPTPPAAVKAKIVEPKRVEPEPLSDTVSSTPTRYARRNLMPTRRKAKPNRSASVQRVKVRVEVDVTIAKDGNYQCPFCAHRVSLKDLILPHITDKHPDRYVTLVFAEKGKQRRETSSPHYGNSNRPDIVSLPSHDPLDGSKYIGYRRRENGKFGSFPLHDDYDE